MRSFEIRVSSFIARFAELQWSADFCPSHWCGRMSPLSGYASCPTCHLPTLCSQPFGWDRITSNAALARWSPDCTLAVQDSGDLDGHSRTGLNPMLNSRKWRSPRSFVKSPSTLNYPIIQSTCDQEKPAHLHRHKCKMASSGCFSSGASSRPSCIDLCQSRSWFRSPSRNTIAAIRHSALHSSSHFVSSPIDGPWTLLLLTASSPGSPNSKRHGNHPTPPGICPRNLGLGRCRKTIQVVSKKLIRNM